MSTSGFELVLSIEIRNQFKSTVYIDLCLLLFSSQDTQYASFEIQNRSTLS